MLINNLKRSLIRHLSAKYTLIGVFSCLLLFICDVLAEPNNKLAVVGAQKTANTVQLPQTNTEKLKRKSRSTKANKSTAVSSNDNLVTIKRDPTRPPSVVAAQIATELNISPEYHLTAIFSKDQQRFAVVNSEIVKIGDVVADMYVGDISSNSLLLLNRRSSKEEMILEIRDASNVKKQVSK